MDNCGYQQQLCYKMEWTLICQNYNLHILTIHQENINSHNYYLSIEN